MREWISSHPYLSGGVVVGMLVLFMVLRKSGGSTSTNVVSSGVDPSISALQIQAGTQFGVAQLQAQTAQRASDAALNTTALNTGAAVQIATLQAAAQVQQILTSGAVTDNQTSAALALGLAQTGSGPSFWGKIGGLFFGVNGHTPVAPTIPTNVVTVQGTQQQTQQQQTQQQQNNVDAATGVYNFNVNYPVNAGGEYYDPSLRNCDPLDGACIAANNAELAKFQGDLQGGADARAANSAFKFLNSGGSVDPSKLTPGALADYQSLIGTGTSIDHEHTAPVSVGFDSGGGIPYVNYSNPVIAGPGMVPGVNA